MSVYFRSGQKDAHRPRNQIMGAALDILNYAGRVASMEYLRGAGIDVRWSV